MIAFKPAQFRVSILLLLMLVVAGCATHYQRTQRFQQLVQAGEFEKAANWLGKDRRMQRPNNRLLFLLQSGWTNWMLGDHMQSIREFDEADLMIEDQHKRVVNEALALLINPTVRPYQPEDFEIVLVNYFKALNFLSTGNMESALVEVRRMNIRLNELNDRHRDRKNRYSDDAFAHVIMGMIFDAANDPNNAFIAYRNALNVYRDIYKEQFNVAVPRQLKKDILRAAHQSGLFAELRRFENEFEMRYEPFHNDGGELVFIWHNGLGPVKAEWSINFAVVKGEGGFVNFVNEDMGITFPFYIGDRSENEKQGLADLSVVRVAFPKYLERQPLFSRASITFNDEVFELELAQDINEIAFKTLNDRMIREMANSLLRLAIRKGLEEAARRENKDLGAAIGLLGAIAERADTRNWQTLPHSIHYVRIPLPEGNHQLTLNSYIGAQSVKQTIEVEIRNGRTTFYTYQNVATAAAEM
jgi:uncharacterized protein